jgi:hypothetical protein
VKLVVAFDKLHLPVEGSDVANALDLLLLGRVHIVLDAFRSLGEQIECPADRLHYEATESLISAFHEALEAIFLSARDRFFNNSSYTRSYAFES